MTIAEIITNFIKDKAKTQSLFTARELRLWVLKDIKSPMAPGSPDRIMRNLRAKGIISYEVVSRQKSLYRALLPYPSVEE